MKLGNDNFPHRSPTRSSVLQPRRRHSVAVFELNTRLASFILLAGAIFATESNVSIDGNTSFVHNAAGETRDRDIFARFEISRRIRGDSL